MINQIQLTNSETSKQRNSSIELLRIIAMFMILEHHFIVHNGFDANSLPIGISRFFFQLTMESVGKIGVIIFFAITSWFLIDKTQTIKQSFKRVWLMEREVLFWSILLAIFYMVFFPDCISTLMFIKSFAPLNFNVWWYATAYAIFLLFLPFIQKLLAVIGRNMHLALCLLFFMIYCIPGFVPGANTPGNVIGMMMVYTFLAAYKWYFKPLSMKAIIAIFITCFIIIIGYAMVSACLKILDINVGLFITGDWKLPMILIGTGIFILFSRIQFSNGIINSMAKSTFAVYLITDYRPSEQLLWARLFPLDSFLRHGVPFALFAIFGVLILIFVVSILSDYIRRGIFALTIDKKQGALFERVWMWGTHWLKHMTLFFEV